MDKKMDISEKIRDENSTSSYSQDLNLAVDSLRRCWTELLACTGTRPGCRPPDLEHLKENAEFAVAQVLESARRLDIQFARTSLKWTVGDRQLAMNHELKSLEKAVDRQNSMLIRIEEQAEKRFTDMTTFDGDVRIDQGRLS